MCTFCSQKLFPVISLCLFSFSTPTNKQACIGSNPIKVNNHNTPKKQQQIVPTQSQFLLLFVFFYFLSKSCFSNFFGFIFLFICLAHLVYNPHHAITQTLVFFFFGFVLVRTIHGPSTHKCIHRFAPLEKPQNLCSVCLCVILKERKKKTI